jgi:integrase/recombinase XerD
MQIIDKNGQRLYLTESEREAFFKAANQAKREIRTFCMVLAYTGCRISEVLSLTGKSIDFGQKAIIVETLKKRTKGQYRVIPVPESLLDTLNMVHGLQDASKGKKGQLDALLWDWSRMTAYRHVMAVMNQAHIPDGPHKSPKGLRHSFGVIAVTNGIPLNMVSKWMGHASLEITSIYANALGEEQRAIAARMWKAP